jgi:hypothetical protein
MIKKFKTLWVSYMTCLSLHQSTQPRVIFHFLVRNLTTLSVLHLWPTLFASPPQTSTTLHHSSHSLHPVRPPSSISSFVCFPTAFLPAVSSVIILFLAHTSVLSFYLKETRCFGIIIFPTFFVDKSHETLQSYNALFQTWQLVRTTKLYSIKYLKTFSAKMAFISYSILD